MIKQFLNIRNIFFVLALLFLSYLIFWDAPVPSQDKSREEIIRERYLSLGTSSPSFYDALLRNAEEEYTKMIYCRELAGWEKNQSLKNL